MENIIDEMRRKNTIWVCNILQIMCWMKEYYYDYPHDDIYQSNEGVPDYIENYVRKKLSKKKNKIK